MLTDEQRAAWSWAKQCAREDVDDGVGRTTVRSDLLLAVADHLAALERQLNAGSE